MNLFSTLLYLTIIMYCITSCQLSKADTNLGLELTVPPWCTNPFTITITLSHVCCSVTPIDCYKRSCIRQLFLTTILFCIVQCSVSLFHYNQYDDDDPRFHHLIIFSLHKLGIEAHAYAQYTSLLSFALLWGFGNLRTANW